MLTTQMKVLLLKPSQVPLSSVSLSPDKTPAFLTLPNLPYKPTILTKPHCTSPTHYNGWDTYPTQQPHTSTTHLRSFLSALGLNDQKYAVVFLIGAVSALAVSRVRVFPIVVFPAGVLVFAVGFSLGFVNNAAKGESLKGFREWAAGFFDEFEGKVGILKGRIEGGEVGLRDLVDGVEEVRLLGVNGRREMEGLFGNSVQGRKSGGGGFLRFFRGLVRDNVGNVSRGRSEKKGSDSVGESSNLGDLSEKVKNVAREEGRGSVWKGKSEKKGLDSVDENRGGVKSSNSGDLFDDRSFGGEDGRRKVGEMIGNSSRFVGREEYSYRSDRLRFVNESSVSSNVIDKNERRDYSVNSGVSFERTESEDSFVEEKSVKESRRVMDSKYGWTRYDNGINRAELREDNVKFKDDFQVSQASADDVAFDRYLAEANDLLKNAKEYVAVGQNEEQAEVMLYKSADLLSEATSMKPMSLLAVGQLGNAYLIHGELKLKTSRELRSVLSGSKPLSVEKLGRVVKGLDEQVMTRNKLTSALIDVCEECEGLLLEAGRKYRLALSIDGSDVRALYNWGLALSYRAQLIADVGPEAAVDADKIFLAAIDKFDAMLSRGNDHAPEALFKWGVALQQRSRLRPRNSKEKVKLLQQAKRLFEDALLMGSESIQVRDALLSCVSELNYRNY